jgi:outer membrane receptor protein involved in Fe transport
MIRLTLFTALVICSFVSRAQHTIQFSLKDARALQPLSGANALLSPGARGASGDSTGVITFSNLQPGAYSVKFSYIGMESREEKFQIPFTGPQPVEIFLSGDDEEEEEEVVIQSTRSTRTIQNIPTRVEFIAGEELDEKANMKPGDIRMVLTESTGIQTQQTSATSANASIRIQGLDGRYTQVLKDGLPLYAGFSGGLGLLQTPPLDLKQIEVIKGSASTLYGGGAIAGLVNLISKTPMVEKELKFHLDATSGGGINTSGFYGQRFGVTGVTVFASRNSNSAYDPSDIGLTAIPKFERYTLNPKLFVFFSEQTQMTIGANFTTEDRIGGDIAYIKGEKPSGFFERNETDRISTQFQLEHRYGTCSHITIKNSVNFFRRMTALPAYEFNGRQQGTFTELTYASHGDRSEWVGGINLLTDRFREVITTATPSRNYDQLTIGAFVQNNLLLTDRLTIETGLRADHVKEYGLAFLPRVSALFKFSPKLTSRLGGGMGYKTPTIFTEETERLQYRNVLPIDDAANKMERSYGINADINYKTVFEDGIHFSLNHLFFYTRISDPLLLHPVGTAYRLSNADGHMDSKGMETNMKIGYGDFKLFLGYTFTKAYLHRNGVELENFLTPRNRVNSVLLYEVDEKWKLGLEAYYFSKQLLSDGSTGRSYWITGFMAEKLWEKISIYINFENFLDSRQTRYGSIYTGSIDSPVFKDIYAPLDGFVMNGGIKLRL